MSVPRVPTETLHTHPSFHAKLGSFFLKQTTREGSPRPVDELTDRHSKQNNTKAVR